MASAGYQAGGRDCHELRSVSSFFLMFCMCVCVYVSFLASPQSWATSVAFSCSTRWSSACGCWPSVRSSVSSWGATTWCRRSPTSCRSLSRRRSLESFWLPSGYVGNILNITLLRRICFLFIQCVTSLIHSSCDFICLAESLKHPEYLLNYLVYWDWNAILSPTIVPKYSQILQLTPKRYFHFLV